MAANLKHADGSKTVIFPSHDPDKQDRGLALELAVERTRDGVIAAAREVARFYYIHPKGGVVAGEGNDYEGRRKAVQSLHDGLATFDAAVAENRAHDSRVWGEEAEPAPPSWNERRGVLLDEVNRTRFYLDRENGSLGDFLRMGADPVIVADQRAEVERRREAWEAAMQRYTDERPADGEPQP